MGTHRILLVEDNPDNQLVQRLMLESLGHTVDCVADGESALRELAERSYDAVFLDLVLPGIDGFEFMRRLRRQTGDPQRPWVVALTAHTMEVDEAMCRAAGANEYLTKPVGFEGLSRALSRMPAAAPPAPSRRGDSPD